MTHPIGPGELVVLWRARAADIGLQELDEADVRHVAFEVLGHEEGPFLPAKVDLLLDSLEGLARRRRGRYMLAKELGRPPMLVADPDGCVDDLADAVAAFKVAAAEYRETAILAAIDREHLTLPIAARRYAVSRRTLVAWRAKRGENHHSAALSVDETSPSLEAKVIEVRSNRLRRQPAESSR